MCRAPPSEGSRAAIAVPVCQGRGGQFGGEPHTQLPRQHPVCASREIVQSAAGREQGEHPLGKLRRDAAITCRRYHLGAVAASVEQTDHPRCFAHAGERHGAARIDPDLQGVAIPPDGKQTWFERWPHSASVTGGADNSSGATIPSRSLATRQPAGRDGGPMR
jgi:hypothetical protein